jgi:hypothetical protein
MLRRQPRRDRSGARRSLDGRFHTAIWRRHYISHQWLPGHLAAPDPTSRDLCLETQKLEQLEARMDEIADRVARDRTNGKLLLHSTRRTSSLPSMSPKMRYVRGTSASQRITPNCRRAARARHHCEP